MLENKVSDLTIDELRAIIRETVQQTLAEMLADPDEGLALRSGVQKSLRQSIQSVKEGAATYAAEDVAKKLGLAYLSERITVNPDQCGGRPCIRGMRIRVVDVLDLLASGLSAAEVLQELPDLEAADILAVMKFSAQRLDHPILAVA